MSLESSHEHLEQEPSRSAISAEMGQNPVLQGQSKGEQLLANVPHAPVPPTPDDLLALLQDWMHSPDWFASKTYLRTHPTLLTEPAAQVLVTFIQRQTDQNAHDFLELLYLLLQIARHEGIDAAYQPVLEREMKSDSTAIEREALQILAPEPETLQEVTTYQTSPDPFTLDEAAMAAFRQYLASGQMTDLNQAVEYWQQALKLIPPNSPEWLVLLNNLGIGLRNRYARTGELADLEAAITFYQQAVQATPPDSPDRPVRLNNLGSGLRDRYARTGELADLEAAITAYQQAVQATPLDSPARPIRLNNLGGGLRDRYAYTGELADLETAIGFFQQAVQSAPQDSPERPLYLNNLGAGLQVRYDRTGELADMEAAISVFQQVRQAIAPNSPRWPALMLNLGNGFMNRYDHTGELNDLEAAITTYQQAIEATPPDSPGRSVWLNNLGHGLSGRHSHTGEIADLEAAITAYRQAVQATPPDSPDWAGHLSNLGNGLHDQYGHTRELTDLQAAITAHQQALQATSPESPHLPMLLDNLGGELRDRYDHTGKRADLEAAIRTWERSWSLPHPRFAALPVNYQLAHQRQGIGIAAQLVAAYLEQAQRYNPRSPSIPQRTLEIAEGSKSRLLTQLVGRGPLPLPVELSQDITAREQQLLEQLTALDMQELTIYGHVASSEGEVVSHLQRLQQRQLILSELEDLWTRIARLGPQGTAYVALRRGAASTWQELASLAKALGPSTALLSFFRTGDQSLLFLLRAGWPAPRMVEISLNQDGWADLIERFFREVHRYSPGLRRGETWDQSLRPLFTKAQSHLAGVERLILSPVGSGHLLPWAVLIEHTGWHISTGQPLPLVTLPTLGILPRLRQRPSRVTGQALVVGNPRGDLPHAEAEVNAVAQHFGVCALLGTAATKSQVLSRLPDAILIHLATHAFFDTNDPLESGIVLADGVLTAREVLQHRLQADLLVLSACESGHVGSLGGEELAGLSQAFLQTGVRSLLVSLWRVNDPATATLIQAFYTARQAGADKALALRQAMTQIQQDPRWTHPYYWGAFVLLGDWD